MRISLLCDNQALSPPPFFHHHPYGFPNSLSTWNNEDDLETSILIASLELDNAEIQIILLLQPKENKPVALLKAPKFLATIAMTLGPALGLAGFSS